MHEPLAFLSGKGYQSGADVATRHWQFGLPGSVLIFEVMSDRFALLACAPLTVRAHQTQNLNFIFSFLFF